jgi:hypothetical protein
MIKIVTDMTLDMKSGIEPRLLLETSTLKLTSMESTVLFEDILAHLSEQGEEADTADDGDLFGSAGPERPSEQSGISEKPPEPEPPREEKRTVAGRPVNLPIIDTSWSKFVENFKNKNQMLAAHLAMLEIREVKDNTIVGVFHNAGGTSKQVVEKPDYLSIITSELRDFFKTNLKIRFEIDANKRPAPAAETRPAIEKIDSQKLLDKDEKLKNLVEKFDGEIIGARDNDE